MNTIATTIVIILGAAVIIFFPSSHHSSNTTNNSVKHWNPNCTGDVQIQISQGLESTNGIPRFVVMVTNMCTNCSVADVHVRCGWFASANLVNPQLFKRLAYDDCIVNGGRSIKSGHVIRFVYSNTYRYDLSVSSYTCQY